MILENKVKLYKDKRVCLIWYDNDQKKAIPSAFLMNDRWSLGLLSPNLNSKTWKWHKKP